MIIDITSWSRAVVDGIAATAPWLVLAGVLFLFSLAVNARGRTRLRLARRGYRGIRGRWRQRTAGTLLPFICIAALVASFAIENEIRNGPNRMLDVLVCAAPGSEAGKFWILESGTDHFMNTSTLPAGVQRDLAGIGAVPFWAELATISRPASGEAVTGLILGGADEVGRIQSPRVESGSRCELLDGRCQLKIGEVVVDRSDGYQLGEVLTVRDEQLVVVGFFEQPTSLLNRSVVFANSAAFTNDAPFGLVAVGADLPDLRTHLEGSGVQIVTTDELRSANSRFWAGNGTPILMMLILLIAGLGASSIYATRRAEHEATRHVTATVRSIGLRSGEAFEIDLARGLFAVFVPALPAVLVGAVLVGFLNSAVLGFHAAVDLRTGLAAIGTVVAATCVATATSYLRDRRRSLVDRE